MPSSRRAATLTAMAACTGLLGACSPWPWPGAAEAARQRALDESYRRGAAALARNDVDTAIAAWREHVRVAPARAARTRRLRGYLTLLHREAARRDARRVAAGERSAGYAPGGRLHVALFPFAQRGPGGALQTGGNAFNRAVLAMITADLAQVPALTVLERERIEQLLLELKLGGSGLVDPATALPPGRLLGAGTVVAGTVTNEPGPRGPGSGRYRINAAVTDVASGRVVAAPDAEGLQAEFFVLQKRVVYGILTALGISEIPPRVQQHHTRSWEAYARFAAGLQALSEDRWDEARAAFAGALSLDPAFLLADDALLDTPQRSATLQEIAAEVQAAP